MSGRKKPFIDSSLKDIWHVASFVRFAVGFNVGLAIYTYNVFLFDKFGGNANPNALSLMVTLLIIYNVATLLSEVPTGAIGDHLGRKKTIITSFVFTALGFFLRSWISFLNDQDYVFFFAFFVALCSALNYTFMSGTLVAWIVDSLRVRGLQHASGPILSRSFGRMFFGQIIGGVIGLSLYLSGHIFYAFALGCIVALTCIFYCSAAIKETEQMSFHQGPIALRQSVEKVSKIIKEGSLICIRTPAVFYIILAAGCFHLLNCVITYLWPTAMKVNYGADHMSPYWFGIVFLNLTVAYFGTKLSSRVTHTSQNPTLWNAYMGVALVVAVFVFGLGLRSTMASIGLPEFIGVIAISQFGYGFLSPLFNTLINNYIPADHSSERATILSIENMFASVLIIFLLFPSSGSTGQTLITGWMIPSGLFFILLLTLHGFMRRYQKKIGERSCVPITRIAAETVTQK